MKNLKDHLEQIINAVSDPIFVKDRQHRWVLINEANCRMMGQSKEKLIGKSDYDFFPKNEADVFWAKDEEVFKSGRENINEEEFTDGDNNTRTVVTKKVLYKDSEGNPFIVGVIRDITRRKQMEEKLKNALEKVKSLSLTDELTGLLNRRGFITLAQQQLKMAQRNRSLLVLLYMDLDGMKSINDTYGHDQGDKALKLVAKVIKFTFRESDLIARIGGDEFVALAIGASRKTSEVFRQNLEKKLKGMNIKKKFPFNLAMSLGVAHFHSNSKASVHDLLKRADKRMYQEKNTKKAAKLNGDSKF